MVFGSLDSYMLIMVFASSLFVCHSWHCGSWIIQFLVWTMAEVDEVEGEGRAADITGLHEEWEGVRAIRMQVRDQGRVFSDGPGH